jgi:hypothetical protein
MKQTGLLLVVTGLILLQLSIQLPQQKIQGGCLGFLLRRCFFFLCQFHFFRHFLAVSDNEDIIISLKGKETDTGSELRNILYKNTKVGSTVDVKKAAALDFC